MTFLIVVTFAIATLLAALMLVPTRCVQTTFHYGCDSFMLDGVVTGQGGDDAVAVARIRQALLSIAVGGLTAILAWFVLARRHR